MNASNLPFQTMFIVDCIMSVHTLKLNLTLKSLMRDRENNICTLFEFISKISSTIVGERRSTIKS